jgi:hypothetical protein
MSAERQAEAERLKLLDRRFGLRAIEIRAEPARDDDVVAGTPHNGIKA